MKLSKLFVCLIWLLTSCSPQEIRYIPEDNSLMQLEFLYPTHWVWEQDSVRGISENLFVNDPKWTTPTPAIRPDFLHELKFIWIYVRTPHEGHTAEEDMNIMAEIASNDDTIAGPVSVILYEDILFHGLPGKHIITTRAYFSPQKEKNELEYYEVYFFHTQDRWYRVSLVIPADERNGTFGKAFDRIIETIEIRNP